MELEMSLIKKINNWLWDNGYRDTEDIEDNWVYSKPLSGRVMYNDKVLCLLLNRVPFRFLFNEFTDEEINILVKGEFTISVDDDYEMVISGINKKTINGFIGIGI